MKLLKNNLKNPAFISVLLAVLIASCASAKYALSDYDTDNDGKLDRSEFNRTLDATKAFQLADADDNGSVSQNEWDQYLAAINVNTRYDADDRGSFETWDLDGDGSLAKNELYNGMFETVDNGANRNDDSTFDNDNIAHDGFIEQAEWNQWYDKDMF